MTMEAGYTAVVQRRDTLEQAVEMNRVDGLVSAQGAGPGEPGHVRRRVAGPPGSARVHPRARGGKALLVW
jgi:hypothetical protein